MLEESAKSSYFYLIDGKTGTGTIQVCIIPGNKNFPRIAQTDYIMCRDRKPICLTAEDADEAPYSAPFVYRITDRNLASMWKLTPHDGMLKLPSPHTAAGCQRRPCCPSLGWSARIDWMNLCLELVYFRAH